MISVRHWLAVLRVWGMRRALVTALALSFGAWACSSSVVALPTFEQVVAVVSLAPPLAGTLLGHSLIEPQPEAARTTSRRLTPLFAVRYAVLLAISAVIALTLAGTATLNLAPAVPAFVALGAVCVAVLREWYWVPMLTITYGWLQLSQGDALTPLVSDGRWAVAAFVVAGGAIYAVVAPMSLRV